jgi:hypothetical protein
MGSAAKTQKNRFASRSFIRRKDNVDSDMKDKPAILLKGKAPYVLGQMKTVQGAG